MDEYDVVIVGAGPAGCTVARYLSDKFNVLLIDRVSFPRDKPCGGLLVKESQYFIKQLEPLDFIFSKPKILELRLMDWDNDKDVKVEREYVNIHRDKFDYWLLQMVNEKVQVMPESELIEFYEKRNGINVVINSNGKAHIIKTKYLIGADGAASTVRKRITNIRNRTYVAIQETVKANINTDSYFIYDSDITDFYSWVIPKGDSVIVGSALPVDNGSVREKFELLKKKLAKNMGINGKYGERESCLILRPKTIDNICLGKNNVLLVGESAGLISPSTGEGISFALRSGYLCAHAINEVKNVYKEYEKLCKPLIDEISDKIIKSDAISDIKSREKVLSQWEVLSEPNVHLVAKQLWAK